MSEATQETSAETADEADTPPTTPVFVEVLTDEEISVLSPPGAMPVSPFLDGLEPDEAEIYRKAAYRGLVARGIVSPPTPEAMARAVRAERKPGEDRGVDVDVRRDVSSLIALRLGAKLIVAIARTTASSQDFWYAHLIDDVVLVEEVSRDGMHRFALSDDERLADLVVAAALHPDSGDAAGDPVPITAEPGDPTPPDRIIEQLADAFVRADVVVRYAGDNAPSAHGIFSGPRGCWWVEVPQGAQSYANPMSADEARARLSQIVDQTRAEATVLGNR